MITLTPKQEDALIEIGNIGMSKAAKQLSILLNATIKITIPKISLMDINKIETEQFKPNEIIASVYQTISKDLQGCSALLFQREQTNLLTDAILGETISLSEEETRAIEQEAILEIGNIIITSCLSTIVNMLSKKIDLSLPAYEENTITTLLQNMCMPLPSRSSTVIALTTKLDTFHNKLSGHLFIILTQESVKKLLNSIEQLIHE